MNSEVQSFFWTIIVKNFYLNIRAFKQSPMKSYPSSKSEKYYGAFEKEKSILIDQEEDDDIDVEGEFDATSAKANIISRQQLAKKKNSRKFSSISNQMVYDQQTEKSDSLNALYKWRKTIIISILILVFFFQIVSKRADIFEKLSSVTGFYQFRRQDSMEVIQNICKSGDKIIQIKDFHQRQQPYTLIQQQLPFNQLPLCILISEAEHYTLGDIKKSIISQNYTNSRLVFMQRPEQQRFVSEEVYEINQGGKTYKAHKKVFGQKIEIVNEGFSYNFYKAIIKKHCLDKSIVVIVSSPLAPGALNNINYAHQTFSAWITYSSRQGQNQIFSFYRRVFDLIEINDFDKTNEGYFDLEDPEWLALSFLELCQEHKRKIRLESMYQDPTHLSRIHVGAQKCVESNRVSYQRLKSLSQSSKINLPQTNFYFKKFMENKKEAFGGKFHPTVGSGIVQKKALQSIETQELLYLPRQHSLAKKQINYYNKTYKIQQYQEEGMLDICATVVSHNNAENNRYAKVIQSLINQEYPNFHIVFIDDFSNDGTFESTKKFIESTRFPADRVTYVRNTERKYLSYNIVHAAFSYCQENQIQVFIDGKDHLIGNQVFKVLNAVYQNDKDVWMSYSTSMTDIYSYGPSKYIVKEMNFPNGERKAMKVMGPLMSWKVKLIKKIPLEYHQYKNGQWIDIMYEDALQHAFYELSGSERIEYIPEILYLESKESSQNSQFTEDFKEKITNALVQISSKAQLSQLKGLYESSDANQISKIVEIFKNDKKVVFKSYGRADDEL